MKLILIFSLFYLTSCSMPSLRLSLETGEATTGEAIIKRKGTTYGTETTGGNFARSIFAD